MRGAPFSGGFFVGAFDVAVYWGGDVLEAEMKMKGGVWGCTFAHLEADSSLLVPV